ncbi:MAG TPA: FtsQ-type POTRA domain-containing protein [Firmicutes bacterium]|jgi:cell division protein FtsQ|nr:FtsQ-type POTRA domain-containing protein [Bacillota bacterium]
MAKQKTNDNWATVVDFPRPVEEKQPKKSFISPGLVYAVLALALLAFAVVAVLNSPLLCLEQFRISGLVDLSVAEVQSRTGVTVGVNMLRINPADVRARLEKHPGIAQVRVKRVFPATLAIAVQERVPVALMVGSGEYLVMDATGHVMATRPLPAEADKPFLTGYDAVATLRPGMRVEDVVVRGALLMLGSLEESWQAHISEVNLSGGELIIYTIDGTPIFFGNPAGDTHNRLVALCSLLREMAEAGLDAAYIDLRYGQPVVKPAGK